MGASAELVAASMILLAERFALPVSASLQRRTVGDTVLAWTLYVALLKLIGFAGLS